MTTVLRSVLVACAGVCAACSSVPTMQVSPSDGNAPAVIVTDPEFTINTLDNGLTVYLRANDTPGAEAHLRLVIDAGSGAEGAGPTGVAHFLEHMLFNGTAEYPANQLTDALGEFGAEFGADVNAYTTYDETVYTLTVPADDDALDTALDILAQWLTAATLDPQEVERERGVVTDEWRQSEQDVTGRIWDKAEQLFLSGGPYEGRDPIGTESDIASITVADLRQFYDRWYRPEHAAVVVVGDVDIDEISTKVDDLFGAVVGRGPGGPATEHQWSAPTEPKAALLVDPDVDSSFVEVTFPVVDTVVRDVETLASALADRAGRDIIVNRLADDIRRGDLAAEEAYSDDNGQVRSLDAPSILVSAADENLATAAAALVAEVERVRRFGVSAGDVERAVDELRAASEERYDSRGTVADVEWADEATEHFLNDELLIDRISAHRLETQTLDALTPEAVQAALVQRLDSSQPHFLAATAITGSVEESGLIALWEQAGDLDLTDRAEQVAVSGQLMARPEAVDETERRTIVEEEWAFLTAEMLRFGNGATVILNPAVISDSSVSLGAVSLGGTSVLGDADVAAAALAADVVTTSGLGELDAVGVDRIMSATSVDAYAGIDDTTEYFYADTSTSDMETAFQYLHQLMRQPGADQVALDGAVGYLEQFTDGGGDDQDVAGFLALSGAMYGDDPRVTGVPSGAALSAVTTSDVQRVWEDRFGDAAGWIFVLVGDFDLDEAIDLARRYVGTLPGTARNETFTNVRSTPTETVRTTVRAGSGEKAQLQAGWWANVDDRLADEVLAKVATQVLDLRLVADLREQLGASYSPSSFVEVVDRPRQLVETTITVTGDPDGMEALSAALAGEVGRLRSDGATHDEYDDAVSNVRRELGFAYQEELLDVLVEFGLGDEQSIDRYLQYQDEIEQISFDDLNRFLARILPAERFAEVTVLPA